MSSLRAVVSRWSFGDSRWFALERHEFVTLHVDAAAAEGYPFGFQPEALFDGGIAAKLDYSAGAKHTLPGKAEGSAQYAHNLPGRSGIASGTGNRAVSGDFAARDLADGGDDAALHVGGSHSAIQPERISHNELTETSSQRTIPCNRGR